ncbi:MFS transporter [Sinomicrobium weinanense]|uniref:MFS transporter n=1 Tax=Sinomicrobium weinanense TaxID=2842200 RepID=A0A926Q4W5_9FLAO|nr:MFS transporter [Sinomicrobium weinanense]MBC9797516.1 MFS transporter [Sinomicrobium weinanense]MBU3122198.1 MFS transporter [Sinomicrobium weinanense]
MNTNLKRRVAVSAVFFLSGICFASWASRIPDVKNLLQLSEGELGGLLLGLPAGSLAALPLAGFLVHRYGSRKVAVISAILYGCALPLLGLAETKLTLLAAVVLFGLIGNLSNVAVNTQAVGVEFHYGKTIMASFHGLWSLAGFVGGAVGAAMIDLHISPFYHFSIIGCISLLIIFFAYRNMLMEDVNTGDSKGLVLKRPDKLLLRVGMIAFCGMMCEGCMFDWSGVYFDKVVNVDAGLVTLGYIAFMSTMATGRFVADHFTQRFGAVILLQFSGILIFFGLLLAVIFPSVIFATIGLLLVGAGTSSVIPLSFSMAGRSKNFPPGISLALVSTIAYFGFLFGPPVIGFIAEHLNLRASFLLVAFVGAMIAVLSFTGRDILRKPDTAS